jgi:hypothetical protein
MREYVGGGRQLGAAVRLDDFPRGIFIEKRLQRFDTLFSRDIRYVGGLTPRTRMPRCLRPESSVPSFEPISTTS